MSATVVAGLAAGALALAAAVLVVVLHHREPPEPARQDRHLPGYLGYPEACADERRRKALARGAIAAAVVAAAGVSVPLWSATQRAERRLSRTAWRPGARLVNDEGRPIHVDELDVDAFTTVWPEGALHAGDSQVVLIRLPPDRAVVAEGNPAWTVAGYVAYSKVCTHMGCPVGLYQTEAALLVCPCHQATFDVIRGAAPVRGPAHRALPQLPIAVDDDGYLVATGDFPEPIGPAYWSRPS